MPVLERSIDPEAQTYDLHLLRATVQLVRVIMEQTGPGDLVIWVADEEQLPDWARRALERFLMTGAGVEPVAGYGASPAPFPQFLTTLGARGGVCR